MTNSERKDARPALSFFVPGIPAPAGSKRAIPLKANGKFSGRVVVVDANPKTKGWQSQVSRFAHDAMGSAALFDVPLKVELCFVKTRPQSHYGRRNGKPYLKDTAPAFPAVTPDVLKLARAVEDACTGVVWVDDSRIVNEPLAKAYGDAPGVTVCVWTLPAMVADMKRLVEQVT